MIELATFKNEIENNTLLFDDNLFIFIGKDLSSEFIFDQYAHIFINNNFIELNLVDGLYDNMGFFDIDNSSLDVFKTDKLEYIPKTFKGWIYCKSVSKDIKDNFDKSIIELPKLEKWQIVDYISTKCHITIEQAEKLYDEYDNIYKLDIESNKLKIFDDNYFDILSNQLLSKDEYEIFDITNALLQRDKNKLKLIYQKDIKVDAFALMSLLIKNFKQVIDIQLARNASAETLGISGKQFWAIQKYNCNRYSREELIYIYKLLTSLDLQIKSGKINTDIIQNYIVFKILAL